jgi:type II secretory pathway pseudopilin PulG
MMLRGQAPDSRGYAMAALIAALSVMAILWTVALPVWSQLAKREKEEELIFRGEQYSRAIGLFQRKYANANPPSLDVLIEQRFLRRKYTDPMTADGEFQLLYQAAQAQPPGVPGGRAQNPPAPPAPSSFGSTTQVTSGGIIGVASKSKEPSVRVYNGRTHYNEWQFIYLVTTQQPGAGAGAPGPRGVGGGLGGRGVPPGGRGLPPGPSRGDGRGGPPAGPAPAGRGGAQFPPPGGIFNPGTPPQ